MLDLYLHNTCYNTDLQDLPWLKVQGCLSISPWNRLQYTCLCSRQTHSNASAARFDMCESAKFKHNFLCVARSTSQVSLCGELKDFELGVIWY